MLPIDPVPCSLMHARMPLSDVLGFPPDPSFPFGFGNVPVDSCGGLRNEPGFVEQRARAIQVAVIRVLPLHSADVAEFIATAASCGGDLLVIPGDAHARIRTH